LRLGGYFSTGPEFWINLQARHDLESAKDEIGPVIDREVSPRSAA
jgi:plasmid maintenance system antidote protein VapI